MTNQKVSASDTPPQTGDDEPDQPFGNLFNDTSSESSVEATTWGTLPCGDHFAIAEGGRFAIVGGCTKYTLYKLYF